MSRQLLNLHRQSWAGSLHVLPEEDEENEEYYDEDTVKYDTCPSDYDDTDVDDPSGTEIADDINMGKSELELYFLTL